MSSFSLVCIYILDEEIPFSSGMPYIFEKYKVIFSCMVIACRDPIPVPEKVRKPLTQVQEFNLHVDHRAVDRAQFDERVTKQSLCFLAWN